LSSHGYRVLQAHDANRAYQMLKQEVPDLIVLDIVLPDVDGLTLCQALRSYPTTRHVPIILVTGTATSTAEKVKGLKFGADDYVLKPFEMDELLERIRALLRRADQRPPVTAPMGRNEATQASEKAPLSPQGEVLSLPSVLSRTLTAPQTLPLQLPACSLAFLVTLIALLVLGLSFAAGTAVKPVVACLMGIFLWGFEVSVLVVGGSLAGLQLRWKEGAPLLSLAAVPLLLKLAAACLFSAWTTLSPMLFTASPLLFFPAGPAWIGRLDAFEIGAVVLLSLLLSKRPGVTRAKAVWIAVSVWALGSLAWMGMLRMGAAA
jgi:CheY-like chemotaxis protein